MRSLLLVTISVVVRLCTSFGVPLPLFLYLSGQGYKKGNRVSYDMILIRTLSLLYLFYIYFYRYNYICLEKHIMIFWNFLDGGPSRNRPLLEPFESLRDGIPGTHAR
jgi:hypothetical protein